MKNRKGTRLLSLLLAVVMLFSLLSVAAFAEEQETAETQESAVVSAGEQTDALEEAVAETAETSNDAADAAETGDDASAAEEEPVVPEDPDPSEQTGPVVTDYATFLADLSALEDYAAAYANEHADEDSVALVINFIRTGIKKYTESTWETFCGPEVKAFTSFVSAQDADNGTHAMDLRALGSFTLPNGNEVEFGHMFGCMDMAYHTGNQGTADLGSWAGDICDLLQLSTRAGVSGTVDEMVERISSDPNLFLYDDPSNHSFGQMDLYADLDAYYILSRLNGSNTIGQIMRSYYTAQLSDSFRAHYFLENRLSGARTRSDIRMAVHEIYSGNSGIAALEVKYLKELDENMGSADPDLRKACCYVFADYLFDTASDYLVNAYYTPFSTERSVIAPGVTQEIKLARTTDNKQLAYYIATADISRGDVSVFANYAENSGSQWQMARVSDQVAAAQAKHTNPDDPDHYIENYNAVVGVNADFYNMSTGQVSGALAMEGVIWGIPKSNGNYFFAILKDGTPIIARNSTWSSYSANIQEAVGGGALLVKDGKIAVSSSTNYYNDRASRTAVGITYDGQIVLMVLDGRQEPWSCGGSAQEIAQIMLDAGCVTAVNLDGGGSTTYVAKLEGSDTATVVNRPSDGFERSVSSSLLVVSTAKPSNVFDHAVVTADYDYLTPGTELEINTRGVTATGGAIDLPEGSYLQVSDTSVGSLEGSVFTAAALGDVQVQLVSAEGKILGSKTLHVVQPTDLKFTSESINTIYGQPKTLPLEATYNGNVVKMNPDDVMFGFLKTSLVKIAEFDGSEINLTQTEVVVQLDQYPEGGTINGFDYIGNGDCENKLRTLTVGAVLMSDMGELSRLINEASQAAFYEEYLSSHNESKAYYMAQEAATKVMLENAAQIKIYLYDEDEATFDFNDATGGDGLLNYKREVSNSNYRNDENAYYVINPEEDMVTSYTFAVDMSKMPIPEQFTDLLYMLPGGDQEGRSAWSFLLQLAERISPLTTVTVKLTMPEGFDVDIKDLKIVNEYFSMTSKNLDGNILTIVANFNEQTQPINPTTANPLCVVSGLKLTPTEDASWTDSRTLDVQVTGTLSYDIYAHFHVLRSMASEKEFQEKYGLFPYTHPDTVNRPLDYGAHFSNENDPIPFNDQYRLVDAVKEGWVREDGAWKYYENGVALTGPQYVRSYDSEEQGYFWFDLGEDGASKGKYTGFAQLDGKWYYAMDGVPTVGWYEIDGDNYYFKKDGSAQTEPLTVGPATYEFNDHGKVLHGCWVTTEAGTRYYYAGSKYYHPGGGGVTAVFREIDGKLYGFGPNGYVYKGGYWLGRVSNTDEYGLYWSDDDGVCTEYPSEPVGVTVLADGGKVFVQDGKPVYCGDYVEYYDADGNQVDLVYGAATAVYYYFGYSFRAARNEDKIINKSNGFLKQGETYHFDDNSQYVVDLSNVKNGIYEEDGGKFFYKDNERYGAGLFRYIDGYYYYASGSGQIRAATQYHAYTPHTDVTGMSAQPYYFDPDGRMFVPEIRLQAVVKATGQVLREDFDGLSLSYGYPTSVPVAPSFLGYELIGWKVINDGGANAYVNLVDGNMTAENLNKSINAVVKMCGYDRCTSVTVTALYKKTADTYTVSATYNLPDGTVLASYRSDPYLIGDAMKITAPEVYSKGGQTWRFDHWLIDGESFSSMSVTLRPSTPGNYDVKAVYTTEGSALKPEVSVVDDFAETINDIHKIGVTMSWSVPEGYEFQAAGFRFSAVDETLQTYKTSATKLTTATGTYTMHLKVQGKEDTTAYICAFLTVKNTETGQVETILTNPVGYTWSGF